VPQATQCRVCHGRLELAQPGSAATYEPCLFRPSHHRSGGHGDLYRCGDCGTVHQPSLPRGERLHDLYRDMSDERYLSEQEGRRRMARRLLDLLARHVPGGRLLDVGCGYGLLLDEARQRGYEAEGVELSLDAVAHARRLGLHVRDTALEDAAREDAKHGERYDAVLAIDVLEHLDDPVAGLERLSALLAPGGALLVTSPDPTCLAARVAGPRWWCYEPAHVCLIPRATLREMVRVQGLELVEDVTAVQSFTIGYWLGCLSERGHGRAFHALAQLATRLPRVTVTASLGDERVMLARRIQDAAPSPSMHTPAA
jgi:SAM-dependent methyltransferase